MNEEEQLLLPLQINSGVVVVVPFFPPPPASCTYIIDDGVR
jgi:hypothetical protein